MKRIILLFLCSLFLFFLFGCSLPTPENINDNLSEKIEKDSRIFNEVEINTNQTSKDKSETASKTSLKEKLKQKINQKLNENTNDSIDVITSFEGVASYLKEHGELPNNYITKSEAKKLGWDSRKGNLNIIAPGKSIGGDIFTNREKVLPYAPGRFWREADIDYTSGYRNAKRILYSNDGLIYKTVDHYKTFERIY